MQIKTALLLLATGPRYRRYINRMVTSAKAYFVEHDIFLWTDKPGEYSVSKTIVKQGEGFPNETLHRFHTFLSEREALKTYDYLFYVDVDAWFVDYIMRRDIFSDGITATLHPGYLGTKGTPEKNPKSTAYLLEPREYFAGGFIGGTSAAFLKMAEVIKKNIDIDTKNNLLAVWHDESHLNRYLYDNPPAKILHPGYCYPSLPSEMEKSDRQRYTAGWERAGYTDFVPKIALANKRWDDGREISTIGMPPPRTFEEEKMQIILEQEQAKQHEHDQEVIKRLKNPGPMSANDFKHWEAECKRRGLK